MIAQDMGMEAITQRERLEQTLKHRKNHPGNGKEVRKPVKSWNDFLMEAVESFQALVE